MVLILFEKKKKDEERMQRSTHILFDPVFVRENSMQRNKKKKIHFSLLSDFVVWEYPMLQIRNFAYHNLRISI